MAHCITPAPVGWLVYGTPYRLRTTCPDGDWSAQRDGPGHPGAIGPGLLPLAGQARPKVPPGASQAPAPPEGHSASAAGVTSRMTRTHVHRSHYGDQHDARVIESLIEAMVTTDWTSCKRKVRSSSPRVDSGRQGKAAEAIWTSSTGSSVHVERLMCDEHARRRAGQTRRAGGVRQPRIGNGASCLSR